MPNSSAGLHVTTKSQFLPRINNFIWVCGILRGNPTKASEHYGLLALMIVIYSAGRRAGLTENLHLWTWPDRGSREGYWLGKLAKNLFFFS